MEYSATEIDKSGAVIRRIPRTDDVESMRWESVPSTRPSLKDSVYEHIGVRPRKSLIDSIFEDVGPVSIQKTPRIVIVRDLGT